MPVSHAAIVDKLGIDAASWKHDASDVAPKDMALEVRVTCELRVLLLLRVWEGAHRSDPIRS